MNLLKQLICDLVAMIVWTGFWSYKHIRFQSPIVILPTKSNPLP